MESRLNAQIDLWLVYQDEADRAPLLDRYRALLTDEERAQAARFHFERHRTQYVITRALVRTVLSGYCNVDPTAWRFSTNDYGRPEIASPAALRDLSFNLAHTDGLIVCACLRGARIGVDAERLRPHDAPLDIAPRFFSPLEVEELNASPVAERTERFFRYWTLKESYIKAIGTGLSTPLDQFSFTLGPTTDALQLSFREDRDDSGENWNCWLLQPSASHLVAVCAERAIGAVPRIVARRAVPLELEEPIEPPVLARKVR